MRDCALIIIDKSGKYHIAGDASFLTPQQMRKMLTELAVNGGKIQIDEEEVQAVRGYVADSVRTPKRKVFHPGNVERRAENKKKLERIHAIHKLVNDTIVKLEDPKDNLSMEDILKECQKVKLEGIESVKDIRKDRKEILVRLATRKIDGPGKGPAAEEAKAEKDAAKAEAKAALNKK